MHIIRTVIVRREGIPNVIELVTIPGGRRLSGAESIDLSFCLDPAGLSLQYSNGHSPTHRWYRQNIPRNSAKHCIEAFVLHKGLLTVVDIFTLPQWYPQEVPAPLEENSGTYLSDPLHTTTRILRREIGKALWPESAQVSKTTLRRSTTTPKLSKNKIFTYRSNPFWTSIPHTFNLRTTTLQMINMFGKVRN